jgi:hypothetical protein
MKTYTETQKRNIAKNIVAACTDVEKLTKQGYDYLYQCNGFIAHYDIYGFKAYYSDYSLKDDIEQNARANQWHNFKPSDNNYDYYMAKRDIYNMILGYFTAKQFINEHVKFIHIY